LGGGNIDLVYKVESDVFDSFEVIIVGAEIGEFFFATVEAIFESR